MTNAKTHCKSSEVFCKPSNLAEDRINEISGLRRMCSCDPMMCRGCAKPNIHHINSRLDQFRMNTVNPYLYEIDRQDPLTRSCLSGYFLQIGDAQ